MTECKSISRLVAGPAACWNRDMAAAAEELDVDGIAVRLTNPDKVYFPKLGPSGTKRKLVEYYLAVAGGPMLTALRDRPTHLQRFPDGIDGEEIYQKRIPQHHPDYLETCRITFPSGRTADALKVTHPAAIVWAAQMGTVTLHPWQVRCPDTDHPDELRVDLDPQPGTGFDEARTVAVDVLRPLLDELGLVGYPKTSGGRGIHVFLRIKTDWDFIAVRRAGIALAREVERRAPDAVTTSWWKEERGKRIFIDFNQNARDRTFASAYSVRRTAIATVSTPLTWDGAGWRRPRRLHDGHCARSGGPPRRPVGRYGFGRSVDCAAAGDGRGRRRARAGRYAVSAQLSEDAGRTETGAAKPGYGSEEGALEPTRDECRGLVGRIGNIAKGARSCFRPRSRHVVGKAYRWSSS